jgi:phosphoribosyl 1,2-cyclic phosphodiesterase
VLIDAGLSGREITTALSTLGVDMSSLAGVLVTHEHTDHINSLKLLHRKYGLPIYANSETVRGIQQMDKTDIPFNVFVTGSSFQVGDLTIETFPVPHDSLDPVGYIVKCNDVVAGIVTDIGYPTTLVRERLCKCHTIVLECNHDEKMLRNARRPWSLKQRIASRHGHLSNVQAAKLIAEIANPSLRIVFLAHLSRECNKPELAVKTVEQALRKNGYSHIQIKLTYQDKISEIVTL